MQRARGTAHRHDETGSCFHDSARVHYWFAIRAVVCRYEAGVNSRPEVVAPGGRKGKKQPGQKGAFVIEEIQHLFGYERLCGCNLWRGLESINLARNSPEGVPRDALKTVEYQRSDFNV